MVTIFASSTYSWPSRFNERTPLNIYATLRANDGLKPKSIMVVIRVTDVNMVHTPTVSDGNILSTIGNNNTPEPIRNSVANVAHIKSRLPMFSTATFSKLKVEN